MKNITKLFYITVAALGLWSCSKETDPYDKPREEIPMSRSEAEAVQNINGLACELMANLGSDVEENFVFSPLSLSYALGMMANGAAGETQEQILSTINMGCDDIESLNGLMKKLMEKLPEVDPKTVVSLANAFWLDSSIDGRFEASFLETLNTYYYADATSVVNLGGVEGMNAINGWSDKHTNGFIPTLVGKPLGSDAKFVTTNALYFKGFWKQQFKPALTSSRRFTHIDGSFTYAYTMDQENMSVQAYDEDDYRVAALPYGNGAYSMIILLPNEGLDPMETFAKASIEDLTKLAKGEMYSTFFHVRLPKFTVQTDVDFVPTLIKMGMTLPFEVESEFFEMLHKNVVIDKVLQGTKIIVDEDGTIAVSSSKGSGNMLTAYYPNNPEFFVDRPFAFAIAERSTGVMLFIGAVRRM